MHTLCLPFRRAAILALLCFVLACPQAQAAHEAAKPDKKAVLLVAFGTSVPAAWKAYDAIDLAVKQAFPDLEVRWAFTSDSIRRKVASEQNRRLAAPAQALADLMTEGYTQVVVQSLHIIPGEEYQGLAQTAQAFAGLPKGIRQVEMGRPLLSSTADVDRAAQALLEGLPRREPGEAVVFMGHGTRHAANIYYPGLQYFLWKKDPLAFVATVEAAPSLQDLTAELTRRGVKKAWLVPFMAVAGDHARNDMAGTVDDSFASVLGKAGVATEAVLRGTGENPALAALWVDHVRAALEKLH